MRFSGAREDRYDAFISYSHRHDMALAEALQAELQTFARPWYRPRVLRVFRDESNLTASPALWASIVAALERSSWFVLMACPEAARSEWVGDEVSWWLRHKSPEHLLIAWTAGDLRWDARAGDFDWTMTDAVPRVLAGAFPAEPRWINLGPMRDAGPALRLGDVVAEFAAPIRGLSKDELVGEHRRRRRQIRRFVAGTLAAMTALAVIASVAGVVAYDQRDEARAQLRNATSRLLATSADSMAPTRLDVAQLLATEAYQLKDDQETRRALFRTVTASPHLVRHLQAGAPITALAGSVDGNIAVAGASDGRVLRWNVRTGERAELGRFPGPVHSVASNADGSVVAAVAGGMVSRWTAASGLVSLAAVTAVSDFSQYDGTGRRVAVSPSGRFLVAADSHTGDSRDAFVLHDFGNGHTVTRARTVASNADNLVLPNDRELVIADEGGRWERHGLPELNPETVQPDALMGAHGYNAAISASGAFFAMDYGGGNLNVWRTDGETRLTEPDLTGWSHGGSAVTAAVSRTGGRVAVIDGGSVHVSATAPEQSGIGEQLTLVGSTTTIADGIEFFGGEDRLLTVDGSALVVWDVSQPARIARHVPIRVPWSCNACEPPHVAFSPDGDTVAVVNDSGRVLAVRGLSSGLVEDVQAESSERAFTLLGWSLRNNSIAVAVGDGDVEFRRAEPGLPVVTRWPSRQDDFEPSELTSDGRGMVERHADGRIRVRDLETGGLSADHPEPVFIVEPDENLVAVDPTSGRTRAVGSGRIVMAAQGDGKLAVQRQDGTLEIWDRSGRTRMAALKQDSSFLLTSDKSPPAIGGRLVAQQRSNNAIALTDYLTGETIGSFTVPGVSTGLLTRLAFTHNGQRLVTVTESAVDSGQGGKLIVWDLSPASWAAIACAAAGRDLTSDEWHRFAATDAPEDLGCAR